MLRTETPLAAPVGRPRVVEDDDRVIIGCTLPPKVAGVPRGAVLLSVPHVLQSTAADAAAERAERSVAIPRLPRAPLVRTRWWGEDRPGSTLFRPTHLSHEQEDAEHEAKREETEDDKDEEEDSGDSSIRMRYPVCVPLEQLLDYLRDTKELVFDIVDRSTRKKIGQSVFSFQLDSPVSSGVTAVEESVQKLRRTNALCEIQSTADATIVLGYLTVNFDIEWTAVADVSTPLKWANSTATMPTISVNPRQPLGMMEERRIQQRLSFSSISSSSTTSGVRPQAGTYGDALPYATRSAHREHQLVVASSVKSDHLDQLLEKGRALERSMSKAVAVEDGNVEIPTDPKDNSVRSAPSPVSMMMLMAPSEAMTEEVDTSWERVLEEAEKIQPPTPGRHAIVEPMHAESARYQVDAEYISLGNFNALEISFESMELEQFMMDRLRQLREGSVSTRFSPIQLVVSHEHPQCLLHQPAGARGASDQWIAAFAVSSSLRKRQWRTNYAHTLPLVLRPTGALQQLRVKQRNLRFRVRCKPQHASPTGTTRSRAGSPSIDLSAEVAVEELLDHRDREWVLSLPLRVAHDGAKSKSTKDRATAKRSTKVGSITVKFQFCLLPDEKHEEGGDHTSESVESPRWSQDDHSHNRSERYRHEQPANNKRDQHVAQLRQIVTDPYRNAWSELGVPVFFGLILNRSHVRWSPDSEDTEHEEKTHSRLSVRIEYGTPGFFDPSAQALRLKRSAKAPLHHIRNGNLRASLRHMNAFPLEISMDFVQKLEKGLVILEVWIHAQSATLRNYVTDKFIGVVKIPLRAFVACIMNMDTIHRCLSLPTPFVGVDQEFPVVDPLNDEVNGHVHVCMTFGSAEQMLNLKSMLAAVIKLQSLARGWLVRKAFGYWKRFELAGLEDDQHEQPSHGDSTRAIKAQESVDPNVSTTTIPGHDDAEVIDSSDILTTNNDHSRQRVVRVELRIQIRENYAKSREDCSIIGCEVDGRLRFNSADAALSPSSSSTTGPRFKLWWDAHDVQLNSHFVHTLQASSPMTGIHLRDVVLLFRVAPQSTASMKRSEGNTIGGLHGTAATDLASVALGAQGGLEGGHELASGVVHLSEDVDLPITWDSSNNRIPSRHSSAVLPLRIGLRISYEVFDAVGPHPLNESIEVNESEPHDQVTTVQTLSRTERLLPASLRLSLDLQRIADVKDMIQERFAAMNRQLDEGEQAAHVLARVMDRGSLRIAIFMSLCLGVELHPEESSHQDVFRDGRSRWHKQFRFDGIELEMSNSVQVLPSITQGEVHVLVHPELVAYLQEESLNVEIFVCEDREEGVSVGALSVPLAAMLFRPSGVQGSFSVRVSNALVGRVGVHLYIDQDNESNASAVHAPVSSDAEDDHQQLIVHRPSSPSSGSSSSVPLVPIEETREQTLEQAVASIHEAALQIQRRLSRLTMRSNAHENAEEVNNVPESMEIPTDESNAQITPVFNPSPTPFLPATSPIERVEMESDYNEEVGDTKARSAFDGEQVEDAQNIGGSEISDFNSQTIVEPEALGGDTDAFRPITLASLGIDEIELSPIMEAASPTFLHEDDSACSSGRSDADDLSAIRDEEENSVADMETQEEQERGEPIVDRRCPVENFSAQVEEGADSLSPVRDIEEKSVANVNGQDEQVLDTSTADGQYPVDSVSVQFETIENCDGIANNGGASPTTESEGDSFEEVCRDAEERPKSSYETTADARNCDSMDGVDEKSIALNGTSATFQPEPAFSGSVTEETCIDDSHPNDGELPPTVVYGEQSTESGETREHGVEGTDVDALEIPVPTHAELLDVHQVNDNDAETSFDTDLVVPTGEVNLNCGGILPCESSTQTHGDEDVAEKVVESKPHGLAPAHVVQADISRSSGDNECKMVAEDTSIQQWAEDRNEAKPTLRECPEGLMTASKTPRGAKALSSVDHTAERCAGPSRPHPSDLHEALPAEKFQIAWQLLNEIRALYVAPDTPALLVTDSSSPSAAEDVVTDQDTSSTASPLPSVREKDSITAMERPDDAAITHLGNSNGRVHATDTRRDQTSVPVDSWAWQDAASLRAEVEERLQASKQEYEEALALSQSISSIKSWSSASHLSTKKIEWEEKAQELSASALAKRRDSRRLFQADTETERIARIMQGSLRNWLRDDDRESETSEEAEYVDNYF